MNRSRSMFIRRSISAAGPRRNTCHRILCPQSIFVFDVSVLTTVEEIVRLYCSDDFTDAYIAFSRRIGTRNTRFHDLRHTHASELLRRGVPLRTVSQRLGHANPTVTLNIYAHVMSGDDERAADTVEEMIRNN